MIMAKFSIEVDTEANTLAVTVNGKKVNDVSSVSAYCCESYDDEGMEVHCNVNQSAKDETGLMTYTSMCASESREGAVASKAGKVKSKDFPELIVIASESQIQRDIKTLLKKYSGAK